MVQVNGIKLCSVCKLMKPVGEYSRDRQKIDGLMMRCKACEKQRRQTELERDRDGVNARYRRRNAALSPEKRHHKTLLRRSYLKTNPLERLKMNARWTVLSRIKRGTLKRLPCEVCRDPKSQAHHYNGYESALDIKWLCQKHHAEDHRKMKTRDQKVAVAA